MKKQVFMHDEFLEKTGATVQDLEQWEKLKLIKPIGYTEDKVAYYSETAIQQVADIRKLLDLGYQPEDIQKIIKKIGLPNRNNKTAGKEKEDSYLTVGQLAEQADISPRTIKHWEDKGILEADMRSEGGFRMYSKQYIYLCKLIKDLQLFGYSLDEIKTISDHFRDFVRLQQDINIFDPAETSSKLNSMTEAIAAVLDKTAQFKEGVQRWEDLLRKKKKELNTLITQNQKREDKQNNEA